MVPLVVKRNPITNSLKSKPASIRREKENGLKCPTEFTIVVGIECLVDGIDDMFNFVYVTRAQVSVAFQHVFFRHLAVWTASLEILTMVIGIISGDVPLCLVAYLQFVEPIGDL